VVAKQSSKQCVVVKSILFILRAFNASVLKCVVWEEDAASDVSPKTPDTHSIITPALNYKMDQL